MCLLAYAVALEPFSPPPHLVWLLSCYRQYWNSATIRSLIIILVGFEEKERCITASLLVPPAVFRLPQSVPVLLSFPRICCRHGMIDARIFARDMLGALLLPSLLARYHFTDERQSLSHRYDLWVLPFGDLSETRDSSVRGFNDFLSPRLFQIAAPVVLHPAKENCRPEFPKNGFPALFVEFCSWGRFCTKRSLIWPQPRISARPFSHRSICCQEPEIIQHISKGWLLWLASPACLHFGNYGCDSMTLANVRNGHIIDRRREKCSCPIWLFFQSCAETLSRSLLRPISVFRICANRSIQSRVSWRLIYVHFKIFRDDVSAIGSCFLPWQIWCGIACSCAMAP